MSAELLRQAATILRERAEAVDNREDWRDYYESDLNPTAGRDDGNWMALMHPGVGLAVARWLEDVAAGWMWDADPDDIQTPDGWPLTLDESMDSHALTVALLIVGESND